MLSNELSQHNNVIEYGDKNAMIISHELYQEYNCSLSNIHAKIMAVNIDMNNATHRKAWGRAVATCDCLEDAIDAIKEFDCLDKRKYCANKPILYYYGIMQALTIQIEALKQLQLFFYGGYKHQNDTGTEQIIGIRNDIVHSCDKKGKESCFIAKTKNVDIDTLWYGMYDNYGNFSESMVNLSEISLSHLKRICQQLNKLSNVPQIQQYDLSSNV